ncbi:hypothetical protein ADP64_000057 [Achromobacter phage phiAxp-2]|uniref:Uncharacterized protein n=1 Tax=Achromobacter phage phiAxp-2 TaxID=1664246 RepID=A0A0K2FH65_9CAUD|nr:hypothetical protein ADP64_000057 [Achromobacter phage phiAxp-2]ALA45413.1 hypothetical protein ADP64_000057 [Achromobacter phage phiAxp-2]
MGITTLLIAMSLVINSATLVVMGAAAIAHMMASRKNAISEVESPWRTGE